jgi:hypothetical protein
MERLDDERAQSDAPFAATSEGGGRDRRARRAAILERVRARLRGRPLACSDSSTMIDGQDVAIPNAWWELGGSLATAPRADRGIVASTSHLFAVKEAA